MTSSQKIADNNRGWRVFGMIGLLLTVALVVIDDCQSQFHNDFYSVFLAAAMMAKSGRMNELYLTLEKTGSVGAPFDVFAHQLLPHLDLTTVFAYPPFVALAFLPFTVLPLKTAMIVWQVMLLCAYFIAAKVFGRVKSVVITCFLSAFSFCPVLQAFLLGQPCGLFIFMPGVLAYVTMCYRRYFLSGLICSFIWFKLQLAPPLAVLGVALLLSRLFKSATDSKSSASVDESAVDRPTMTEPGLNDCLRAGLGFAVGTISLFGFTVLLFGWTPIKAWIELLGQFSKSYYDPGYLSFGSVPCALLFFVPPAQAVIYRQLAAAGVVLGWLSLLMLCYRLFCSNLNWALKMDLAITLLVGGLPLFSYYLGFYDNQMYLLVLWLCLFCLPISAVRTKVKQYLLTVWIGLNAYFFCCASVSFYGQLLLLVLFAICVMYVRVVLEIIRIDSMTMLHK